MFLRSVTILKERMNNFHAYPFSLPLIKRMESIDFSNKVTFFVGENGSGKSTLLEAIAYQCGFNTAGGGRNNAYFVESSEAALGNFVRLSWFPKITTGFFLRAESFYEFASHIDLIGGYNSYGGRSLHSQSHGESFLSLFKHRFKEKGIYLLDEPEAALSPARQLSLLRIIKELSDSAQFIIATHSPILLGYPDAQIINFDSNPISQIAYEDTDHYQITRRFLENRQSVLRHLFED
ncbi:AAA family ATPase [Paenibacillus apiarius]|uniref:AAA family ATPase n=1 Tax=Paenibacillus apiarius TaxID=46240 RepID=A0ABT4E0V0_9BACL|nr:AAA family ATPase [Paenibacillus apiarius]MCY9517617.1 AAA family ATPase [Paenibacillus apiarius]MCY9522123.1 AAA family ATPase [Paenibacillus apiarius]MCY9552588.1 AAA family ATPase [Paenibacillus apiarius]MCY9559237.1 AAA family ATPase [Paenibacillus apiarius]MCY9683660.1 AAA family ATPase [Paenibacillus apiarius]